MGGAAGALLAIAAGAVLLRVVTGVGFANYDTLYALVWGQQLTRGETPQYGIPIAPTPHPLVEALGVAVAPLGPHAATQIVVALGFLALAACGWAVYRLGSLWFNRAAGAVAALLLVTRVPILSYGVRAYVDVPYLLLVLCALIVETRRRRAGAPVLALLSLAGLLRPEAWVFAGLYWLYLAWPTLVAGEVVGVRKVVNHTRPNHSNTRPNHSQNEADGAGGDAECDARTLRQLAGLALLALSAPLVWVASDWLVTGQPLWSLTNTRATAETLHRETGIAKVPEYIPRRIGEVLGAFALVPAALGGLLALLWLRSRVLTGAAAGVVAVAVFAAFAGVGLPIDERYAFPAAAILCVFAGGALCGWWELPREDPRRRRWLAAAAVGAAALLASIPSQYHTAHRQLQALGRQQRIQNELVALVRARAIVSACAPIGVPNHAPLPLLALWLETPPREMANLQSETLARGTYVDPADAEVQREYILDPNDPHRPVRVPRGFALAHANRSWRVWTRCG